MNISVFGAFFKKRGMMMLLHIVVLLLSLLLIAMISYDSFKNTTFYEEYSFQKWQFWICMVFIVAFFVELAVSENKWRFFWTNLIFLLVSVPYQAIIYHYGIHLSQEVSYLIRYMPLIRGGYALAIVVSWFTYNKATGLFFTYIIILLSTVYFASLTFYLFETGVNPLVNVYSDALWWAAMDVTTVGSNITAVTGVGRVLSVLLAALGMMMFPIFTVYVTNVITQRNKESKEKGSTMSLIEAYKEYVKNHPEGVDKESTKQEGKIVAAASKQAEDIEKDENKN
ncbi:MAG: two pore domain potassium channel family protein [Bacteroidales bacterium]|nr:two pore domain potassium channel family protein [Bacteroidales bacterium]